jgi:hypothetical protein
MSSRIPDVFRVPRCLQGSPCCGAGCGVRLASSLPDYPEVPFRSPELPTSPKKKEVGDRQALLRRPHDSRFNQRTAQIGTDSLNESAIRRLSPCGVDNRTEEFRPAQPPVAT